MATFRFSDLDTRLQEELANHWGVSRTQALRQAVDIARKEEGLYKSSAEAFLTKLRDRFEPEAELTVELDERFDAFAKVDDERQSDLYLPTLATILDDGEIVEDFVRVYLGDPNGDTRLLLGLLPLRTGIRLSVPIEELKPDMPPRPVAYWPANGRSLHAVADVPSRQANPMAMRVREVVRVLEANGWRQVRQKGSHRTFRHPDRPEARVVVPGNPGKTLATGTLATIRRTSGLEDLR